MNNDKNTLNRELLCTKIVKEIISFISAGTYVKSRKLPSERELCNIFSTSRGTIRQGLSDLEKLGVIKIKPNSGAYIQDFSYKQLPDKLLPPDFQNVSLDDIVQARKVIESAAIELLCEKNSKKDIKLLSDISNKMENEINNLPSFVKLDMEFHQSIVRASGNTVLATAFEAISEYHKYSQVYTSLKQGEEEIANNYHKKILKAIIKRNKKKAVKILDEHLSHMEKCSQNPYKKIGR